MSSSAIKANNRDGLTFLSLQLLNFPLWLELNLLWQLHAGAIFWPLFTMVLIGNIVLIGRRLTRFALAPELLIFMLTPLAAPLVIALSFPGTFGIRHREQRSEQT